MNIIKIKDSISIEEVLEHFGQEIPTNKKIKCLWHDDGTASLQIYSNGAYCFGCGKPFDIFDFIEKFTGLSGFIENRLFLENTFLNDRKNFANRETIQKSPSSVDAFNPNAHLAVIAWIARDLNTFTQACVKRGRMPDAIYKFLVFRSLDFKFLIQLNILENNILFLDDRHRFINRLKSVFDSDILQQCGLLKPDGKVCTLNDQTYALLFLIWSIKAGKIVPTSISIRNIDPNSTFPKELEFIISGKSRPATVGFIGLKYAFSQYPDAVQNYSDGLTVFLCEGTVDYISAHELIHNFNILGDTNEKIIILTAGGIHQTAKKKNLELIKNCARIICAFDNDTGGTNGFKTLKANAQCIGIKQVDQFLFDPSCKDLNDLLIAHKKGKTHE